MGTPEPRHPGGTGAGLRGAPGHLALQQPPGGGMQGERVGGRSIVLKSYPRLEDLTGCQILFISRTEVMSVLAQSGWAIIA